MKLTHTFKAHESHVNSLLFSPDGKFLISAGMDNLIRIWSLFEFEFSAELEGHSKSVNSICFAKSNGKLISADSNNELRIWSWADGECLDLYPKTAGSAVLSPDGSFLAAVIKDRVNVYRFPAMQKLFTINDHTKRTHAAAFSVDSRKLFSGGFDTWIHGWTLPDKQKFLTLNGHDPLTLHLACTPDGKYLLSTGYDLKLKIWDILKWLDPVTVDLNLPGVGSIAISNNSRMAVLCFDHTVVLVAIPDGTILHTEKLKPKGVYCAAFSIDDRFLAVGSADKQVRIFALYKDFA